MMSGLGRHFIERRRSVDIPVNSQRRRRRVDERSLELPIEDADPARLNENIRPTRSGFKRSLPALGSCGIDDHASPIGIWNITMALPFERIRLIKHDLMSERGEGAQDAAVIRGGTVPIARHKAGPEEGYSHEAIRSCGRTEFLAGSSTFSSSTMASSS